MYKFLVVFSVVLVSLFTSCRNDFETVPSSGSLTFSKDTVFLDTTFTRISTNTYTLKVYNPTSNDITIPTISLENTNSYYRMMVDGQTGISLTNIDLLAKDSLFIFVETTVDFTQLPATENNFIYEDKILFDAGTNKQEVVLVTLIKDAVFLFPEKKTDGTINTILLNTNIDNTENHVEGFELTDSQLTWTKDKPYVIYGYAVVPPNKTLSIEPGARIHFHENSGILVSDNASIQANGLLSTTEELENEIIFEGDKLQDLYHDIVGQWGTIWLKPESSNNLFEYTTIKNGTIGIRTEAKDLNGLHLKNTKLFSHSNYGLLSENGFVKAENCVINEAGISPVSLKGGNYDFNHCTVTNYWNSNFGEGTFNISNKALNETEYSFNGLFSNCIIYGSRRIELTINKSDTQSMGYLFDSCLIKFDDRSENFIDDPLYDFNNASIMSQVILNEEPDFKDPNNNELQIGLDSKAIGKANLIYSTMTPTDIINADRTTTADIGAYQATDIKAEE